MTLFSLPRRFALILAILAMVAAPLPAFASPAFAGDAIAAETGFARPLKETPVFDRGLMLMGCMGGLALGAISTILPPVAGWAAAGIWMGGLGTMILRSGLGCGYGALAGAVSSAARSSLHWVDATWRKWTGRPAQRPAPLPIEGPGGA
ncbi:MAG: hypothetical protein WCF85_03155 [Rhodospirillaceae bacterium]